MEIHKLWLQDFGQFHNREIELRAGINVIFGPNEAGKTTGKAFILGMLYGIDKARGIASRTDEYAIREPLEGYGFSGEVEYELNGKHYQLERNFRKDNRRTTLRQLPTGRELYTSQDKHAQTSLNLGWPLDRETYRNTLCVDSETAKYKETLSDTFHNYVINLATTKTNNLDRTAALATLTAQRKQYHTREIDRRLNEIAGQLTHDTMEQELLQLQVARKQQEEQMHRETEHHSVKPKKGKRMLLLLFALIVIAVGIFSLPQISLYTKRGICAGILFVALVLLAVLPQRSKPVEMEQMVQQYSKQMAQLQLQEDKIMERQQQQEELQEQYQLLKQERVAIEKTRKAYDLAIETMERLSGNIYADSSEDLQRMISQIMTEITGGAYTEVVINEHLELQVRKGQHYVGIEHLSKGTVEQLYLAVRLAVAEQVLGEDTMPILLDDCFASYDEQRLRNMLSLLARQTRQQIILFTANSQLADILDGIGTDYNYVQL